MANRVVLGAFDGTFVLRASRPGSNVLTTTLEPEFLAFDSQWQAAANVLSQGSVQMKSYLGNLTSRWWADIVAPVGLARAPIIVAMCRHQTSTNLFVGANATGQYDPDTGAMSIDGGYSPWTISQAYLSTINWGFMSYIMLRAN